MAKKTELIKVVLDELRRAQTLRWSPPPSGLVKSIQLPPTLWFGDGRSIGATDELLVAVREFARIQWENEPEIRPRLEFNEFLKLTEQSFAIALSETDLDENDEENVAYISARVSSLASERLGRHSRELQLTVGCHLFASVEPFPLRVGPVLFETREGWLVRMLDEGKVSLTTARRLRMSWSGRQLRKRKASYDAHAERALFDAIGGSTVVCTVTTDGLSSKYVQTKGLLAARLAMAAFALLWNRPSEGLRWMRLQYDRKATHRYLAIFGDGRIVGSNAERVEFPSGRYVDADLLAQLKNSEWLFEQVGEALLNFVQPTKPSSRPITMNALFLSLWWFHEACREPSNQIATTMFAAAMDSLAGNKAANGIGKLITARLGPKPDDPLFRSGEASKTIISQIYDAGRSRFIHGSSKDFAHDWSETRGRAEIICRMLLVSCCDWLHENPQSNELKDLSRLRVN